jgi:hypothetical protein
VSILNLPNNPVSSLTDIVGSVFNDLWVLVAFSASIPIAFWLIEIVIGMVKTKREAEQLRLTTSEASIGLTHEEAEAELLHARFKDIIEDEDDISIYT